MDDNLSPTPTILFVWHFPINLLAFFPHFSPLPSCWRFTGCSVCVCELSPAAWAGDGWIGFALSRLLHVGIRHSMSLHTLLMIYNNRPVSSLPVNIAQTQYKCLREGPKSPFSTMNWIDWLAHAATLPKDDSTLRPSYIGNRHIPPTP
jgi:hypothetical protein